MRQFDISEIFDEHEISKGLNNLAFVKIEY